MTILLFNPITPEVINMLLLPLYPYIIQQTGNENTPTYEVEVVILI